MVNIPALSAYQTQHVLDFLNCPNSKCFDLLSHQAVTLDSNFLFRKDTVNAIYGNFLLFSVNTNISINVLCSDYEDFYIQCNSN